VLSGCVGEPRYLHRSPPSNAGLRHVHAAMGGASVDAHVCTCALRAGSHVAFVATCRNEVVAVATLTESVDVALLRANFNLDALMSPSKFPPEVHAELGVLVINPIFEQRVGLLLSGILREAGKSCLHYALLTGQTAPVVLPAMMQVGTCADGCWQ